MDAKITKNRLSNLISYDWIKILLSIVAAVLVICVFFTTIKTRAREEQLYKIYGYGSVSSGSAETSLADDLKEKGVFSYDVLDVSVEVFGTGQYSGAAFTARRMAGEGSVMFLSDRETVSEENESGTTSELREYIGGNPDGAALDVAQWLTDCENYLVRFFGENWREGTLDEAETEACFLDRNAEDNRYRKEDARADGIEDEKARLEKLRADYIYVLGCFDEGKLTQISLTNSDGGTKAYAVGFHNFANLSDLLYYTYEEEDGTTVRTAEKLCMILFSNDDDVGKGAETENDLRFETISFLRYLVETYGASS